MLKQFTRKIPLLYSLFYALVLLQSASRSVLKQLYWKSVHHYSLDYTSDLLLLQLTTYVLSVTM